MNHLRIERDREGIVTATEPQNKGHAGTSHLVLYKEAVDTAIYRTVSIFVLRSSFIRI